MKRGGYLSLYLFSICLKYSKISHLEFSLMSLPNLNMPIGSTDQEGQYVSLDESIIEEIEESTFYPIYRHMMSKNVDNTLNMLSEAHSRRISIPANKEYKNLSEVATAAYMVDKLRKASLSDTFRNRSRRNATNLSDAKVCAIYHQRSKLDSNKKLYKYGHNRSVNFIHLIFIFLHMTGLVNLISFYFNQTFHSIFFKKEEKKKKKLFCFRIKLFRSKEILISFCYWESALNIILLLFNIYFYFFLTILW